ncbi:fructose-specific PTS transporter subunit EIIC [Streptomyces sp. TRM76323]|uniref:Fructose-specific PTS transporter subunit EIIC n=1 Tax=Streptomyces tamarix TaxID=3078565 RepID=A0ABU3QRH6_9ACTN|nr:fructose-specific PTS transporter subunit EIIC [Streptomyces tamarix]MDT9685341.1 fructose-specific PTS transporter subunit EIIC [Streptomyces tamarix]
MNDMITADLVDLDLAAQTKQEAARSLAERMVALSRVTDLDGFLADVAAREAQMPTGLDGGIGIPHCRSAHVTEPTLAFGRAAHGVDFGAPDGPADLIFLIAAPAGADDAHLTILSSLARSLMDRDFTTALRATASPVEAAALLRGGAPLTPGGTPPDTGPGAADTGAGTADNGAGAAGPGVGTAVSGTGTAGPGVGTAVSGTGTADPGVGTAVSGAGTADPEAATASAAGATAGAGAGATGAAPEVGAPAGDGAPDRKEPFRIVAVTSCPTGIAHTYMAAEALEQAGRDAGVEVTVETQGSAGFTRLDPATVAAADGVIFAHDVAVRDKERFAGKPTVDVGVKAGINRAAELIAEVRAKAARGETTAPATPAASRASGAAPVASGATPVDRKGKPGEGYGTRLREWLMSGVGYMVPFVAAGGLLIALGFAIGGWEIDKAPSVAEHFAWGRADSWAALMFQIGGLAFGFLVPVLAGYIAYGMADRPGLVPGFVGGAVALTIDAGFLGGLAAGLLAGGVVMAVQRLRVPSVLRGIMPVVVIPLVASAVVGFLMFLVVGKPIASLQKALTDWLSGLTGANAVVLGVILGLMMSFDLGGPVNKVAYAFAVGGLATPNEGSLKVMAAVMAAGMVPPLAMALATTVRGRLFTRAERENGKAAWVLGASFISEGAIPFAAADPLRVIPSAMAGGAVTGALSMAFEATLRAPHGGIFVVPLIGNPFPYLLAVLAGTLVSAALVVALKSARKSPTNGDESSPGPDPDRKATVAT